MEYTIFTLEDIRKKLAKMYDEKENGSSLGRELFVVRINCNYGKVGCVFFALNGSPPKGYCLYVPDHGYVLWVDAWGKSFRQTCTNHSYGVLVSGWEDLPDDITVLPGKEREKKEKKA